jgi:hypothetical protein
MIRIHDNIGRKVADKLLVGLWRRLERRLRGRIGDRLWYRLWFRLGIRVVAESHDGRGQDLGQALVDRRRKRNT